MLRPESPEQRAIYTALIEAAEAAEATRLHAFARMISNEQIERHLEVMEALGQITRTPAAPEP